MSIENVLSLFLETKIAASSGAAAISGAILHEDTYEEIGAGSKWIRVDIMTGSLPAPYQNAKGVREFNANIAVQFIARPADQGTAARRTACGTATDMANEIARLIDESSGLNDLTGAVCNCVVRKKMNDWHNLGTNRVAVSYLILELNT